MDVHHEIQIPEVFFAFQGFFKSGNVAPKSTETEDTNILKRAFKKGVENIFFSISYSNYTHFPPFFLKVNDTMNASSCIFLNVSFICIDSMHIKGILNN